MKRVRAEGPMWNWTPKDKNKRRESFRPKATHIGKSIVTEGEVSGGEILCGW